MANFMKFFLFTLFYFIPLISEAQSSTDGICFFEGTFNEAIAEAKSQQKNLFIDCYTSWCGPCKRMSNGVFTQKNVGDYFNKNFICLKVDMEKERNRNLSSSALYGDSIPHFFIFE